MMKTDDTLIASMFFMSLTVKIYLHHRFKVWHEKNCEMKSIFEFFEQFKTYKTQKQDIVSSFCHTVYLTMTFFSNMVFWEVEYDVLVPHERMEMKIVLLRIIFMRWSWLNHMVWPNWNFTLIVNLFMFSQLSKKEIGKT